MVEKRIAFIIPSIDFGGAELQIINQINYLVKARASVLLIVVDKINNLGDTIHLPNDRIIELHYPVHASYSWAVRNAFSEVNKIAQILEQYQIQVVLANLPFTHYLMRLVKVRSFFNSFKFCLINYHHSLQYIESPLDTRFKKIFNSFNSGLARIADDVNIFISDASKNNVAGKFFIKNPVIIFNSIPFKSPDDRLAQDYISHNNLRSGNYTIVLPGRLHQAKGHIFFIDVLERLIQTRNLDADQIQIFFVGDGPLRKEILDCIQAKGLQGFFHITGFVDNKLLLSFMAISDLVVIPSIFEGFGNVALEALMVNKLILSSDAGGLKEIIRNGENGFQFRAQDAEDCFEKLDFLFANNNLEILSKEKLAEDFRIRFSFESHMHKLIQQINSCVE